MRVRAHACVNAYEVIGGRVEDGGDHPNYDEEVQTELDVVEVERYSTPQHA